MSLGQWQLELQQLPEKVIPFPIEETQGWRKTKMQTPASNREEELRWVQCQRNVP